MANPSQKPPPSRFPAPTLFVGPPSRNASNTSLLQPTLTRSRSHRGNPTDPISPSPAATTALLSPDGIGGDGSGGGRPSSRSRHHAPHQQQPPRHDATASNERIDALWAQMQNTLEEVELSAVGGAAANARFGPGHARALEELREAQIALAQAWGRGAEEDADAEPAEGAVGGGGAKGREGDGAVGGGVDGPGGGVGSLLSPVATAAAGGGLGGGGGGTAAGGGADRKPRSRAGSSEHSERGALEEETERDLRVARGRREANDRYFQRVNAGVRDVVAKLEDVARAMKGVELESKEMWGEGGDSIDTGSVT